MEHGEVVPVSVRVLEGHVLDVLPMIAPETFQTCVTSPPYWQLRDYGTPPQVWGGHRLCAHEWGDLDRGKRKDMLPRDVSASESRMGTNERQGVGPPSGGRFCLKCDAWLGEWGQEPTPELYVEHMVLVFSYVRRVLRDDGTLWLNIGDTYWNDPGGQNGGEGIIGQKAKTANAEVGRRKRATGSHHPTLKRKDLCGIPWRVALALQADGWWLRSDVIWAKPNCLPENVTDRPTRSHEYLFLLTKGQRYFYDADAIREAPTGRTDTMRFWKRGMETQAEGDRNDAYRERALDGDVGRNKRSVWSVPVASLSEAHFAVFPPALIEPCIKAGSAPGDDVLDICGGSGTTGMVADRLGRNATLIELKPEYAAMSRRRITNDAPLFAEVL